MYLFIDSTYDLCLGILDEDFNWLNFDIHSVHKSSGILQSKVNEILIKNKTTPSSLRGVFTVNGPGFYTGLRLAEGFSDVFSFFGINQYSFYTYEIPFWCGYKKGTWFTKAYRGEHFFYNWHEKSHSFKLIKSIDLDPSLFSGDVFSHSESSSDPLTENLIPGPIHTTDLLQEKPQQIFPKVIQSPSREPFYFRAPEDEFKVNP